MVVTSKRFGSRVEQALVHDSPWTEVLSIPKTLSGDRMGTYESAELSEQWSTRTRRDLLRKGREILIRPETANSCDWVSVS